MSQQLLPCPFCGASAEIKYKFYARKGRIEAKIFCPKCKVFRVDAALNHDFSWVEKVAINHWNDRSTGEVLGIFFRDYYDIDELLSCPFCGCEPKVMFIGNELRPKRSIAVKCSGCRLQQISNTTNLSFEELTTTAVKRWNRRSLLTY